MTYEQAERLLKEKGQEQLLRFYKELNGAERSRLLEGIEKIDWSFEEVLKNPEDLSGKGRDIRPIEGMSLKDIKERREEFFAAGAEAIRSGKVAAVLLAGGQGTRLGVDGPKGAYNIGITRPLYIFEQQMKNLTDVVEECGAYIPLYVMTSEKNHGETVAFWQEHDMFGYPASEIKFFVQDMAPAVDFEGKIYLESKDYPALSPNGNGGWFSSMLRAGLC